MLCVSPSAAAKELGITGPSKHSICLLFFYQSVLMSHDKDWEVGVERAVLALQQQGFPLH